MIDVQVILIIADPWELYKIIDGKIILYSSKNGFIYFVVEDINSTEKYFVSTRFKGDKLSDLFQSKLVNVAIAIRDNIELPIDVPDIAKHLKYIGIGSIELALHE